MTTISPSISSTSFNCPHCRVLAQQFWWYVRSHPFDKDNHPVVWIKEQAEAAIKEHQKSVQDQSATTSYANWARSSASGEVTFGDKPDSSYDRSVDNVYFSKCYSCNRISVWIYDRLVHPASSAGVPDANPDMPADVHGDYEEASRIAILAPRGAAALLRLAIQRLMPHLGQKGKDLNEDIQALVKAGLDPRIQRSLDIVRVIGNHAVHPGQIDLRDNQDTVSTLFKLVNVIVDSLISRPKQITEAYGDLPENARSAIERRDHK